MAASTFLPCLITIWFTCGSIMVGRGVFFVLAESYNFNEIDNIWVGVFFGMAYAPGAMISNRLSKAKSFRFVLYLIVIGHALDFLIMGLANSSLVMVIGFVIFSLLQGMMWPFVESYVTGGKVGRAAGKAIAKFSMSWAFMLPMGIVLMGAIKQYLGASPIFYISAVLFILGLFWVSKLPKHPADAQAIPEPMEPAKRQNYKMLAKASQWSMVTGYALHQLLAPVWPQITQVELAIENEIAQAAVSGTMDYARAISFFLMWWTHKWYGKKWVVTLSVVGSVVGFLMIYILQTNLTAVLVGSVLFGLTEGISYFAALYYGMLSQESTHDGGAKHEIFVGLGFTIGPILGLVGMYLYMQEVIASKGLANMIGLSPIIILGLFVVLRILYRKPKTDLLTG